MVQGRAEGLVPQRLGSQRLKWGSGLGEGEGGSSVSSCLEWMMCAGRCPSALRQCTAARQGWGSGQGEAHARVSGRG